MEEIRVSELAHRQVRSEALQPVLDEEESRQSMAHWGNWLMRLLRSPPPVEVEAGAELVMVPVADWAAAEAIKIADVARKVVICMLAGVVRR